MSVRVTSISHTLGLARPTRTGHAVVVADVPGQVVFVDDLAHVLQDLLARGYRRARPRLEAVAERIEVAVGAGSGEPVHQPCPTKALQSLQDHKAAAGALAQKVARGADARNAGTDDHYIEMLRDRWCRGPRQPSVLGSLGQFAGAGAPNVGHGEAGRERVVRVEHIAGVTR